MAALGIDEQSYKLASGILSVAIEGQAVLLSLESGNYYGVNGSFRHLLEELRDGLTRDEMIARTCARYDVLAVEAADDLDQILAELIAAKLIERTQG